MEQGSGGTADRSLRIRHEYNKKKMTSVLDYCFPRLATQFTYSYNLKQALHHLGLWPRTPCMPTSAKMMGSHLVERMPTDPKLKALPHRSWRPGKSPLTL